MRVTGWRPLPALMAPVLAGTLLMAGCSSEIDESSTDAVLATTPVAVTSSREPLDGGNSSANSAEALVVTDSTEGPFTSSDAAVVADESLTSDGLRLTRSEQDPNLVNETTTTPSADTADQALTFPGVSRGNDPAALATTKSKPTTRFTSTPKATATTSQPTTSRPTTAKATTTTKPATTTTSQPATTPQPPRSGAFFSVDFQGTPTGAYTDARIRSDWSNTRYTNAEDRATITDEGGNRFVRIKFPKGQVGNGGGGASWDIDLASTDELYASYRLRFVGSFDPVLGGKLPGLGGGQSNTGGDKPTGSDGWTARMMWRSGNSAVQYLYHPDQPSKWGEDLKWSSSFPKNQWVTVETRIKMNAPGRKDGVVQSWMNGQLVLSRTDIRFRDTNSFSIDRFLFNTFFGGSGSEWAPTKDEYIDFDDFLISRSPITH